MHRLLVLALALAPATLRAQPAPDAPVARHVTRLLELASAGFRDVRGELDYQPGATQFSTPYRSTYPVQFRGTSIRSTIWVNTDWNVLHTSWLPVGGDRVALPAAWASMADSIRAVLPPGWAEHRIAGERPFVWWAECEGTRGRQVSLAPSLPFEAPGLVLYVYRFDEPCPAAGR
jgi:hypothetical protein